MSNTHVHVQVEEHLHALDNSYWNTCHTPAIKGIEIINLNLQCTNVSYNQHKR